eukprot:GGOE01006488.1.p1 GENE.GGOE01006488.1~~GGOE01006488.1.p1  ORF type:complete len:723 (-),score=195.98 GGOE01006488.1:251-2389(-)
MSSEEDSRTLEPAMFLKPLSSPNSRREVLAIVDAYSHFWTHHKFAQGLAAPPCQSEDVTHLLYRAASIAVYIRRHLDREDSAPKVRVSEGSAHEFLWSIGYDPRQQPDRFVRDLVHATFKDSAGYVEDLTEACVDEYIAEIEEYYKSSSQQQEWWSCAGQCGWQQAKPLADRILEQVNTIAANGDTIDDRARWQSVCSNLEAASRHLTAIISALQKDSSPPEPKSPVTPATPFLARLARKKNKKQRRKQKQRKVAEEAKRVEEAPTSHREPAEPEQSYQESTVEPSDQGCDRPDESIVVEQTRKDNEEKTPPSPVAEDGGNTEDVAQPAQEAESMAEESPEVIEAPSPESEVFKITIGKLHQDVAKRREDVRDLVEASQALPDDPNVSRQLLEKLQKRCLESSEHLMRDMLTLDSLVASTLDEKAKRKEQILQIQDILETLDLVSEKLRVLSHQMDERKEEIVKDKEEALTRAQEEAEQLARSTSDLNHTNDAEVFEQRQRQWAEQKSLQEVQRQETARKLAEKLEHIAGLLLQDDAWRALKLKPRFDVSEQPTAYTVKAFVPGMRSEDVAVNLSEDGSEFIVQGARVPTREQTAEMQQQLGHALRRGHADAQRVLGLTDEQLLLLAGSGRYGSFEERFALPDDADTAHIQAEYERGVLVVYIPRRQMSYGRLFPHPAPCGSPPGGLASPLNPYWPQRPNRAAPPSFDSLFW